MKTSTKTLSNSAFLATLNSLASIAMGRDHINTAELAKAANCAPQTVRKNHCLTGECFGIRPVKVGNRLLWPVDEVARILNGEVV